MERALRSSASYGTQKADSGLFKGVAKIDVSQDLLIGCRCQVKSIFDRHRTAQEMNSERRN